MPEVLNVRYCTLNKLRQTTRSVAKLYDTALLEIGLKSTQFSLLAAIKECKSITLSELATVLVMDRTTLTRNLKALTAKDYVLMHTSEEDRRIRIIELGPAGYEILEQALPLWQQTQSKLIKNLGNERWAGIISELDNLTLLNK